MMSDAISIHGARLSRRRFLGTGGALYVALTFPPNAVLAAEPGMSLDAAKPSSWIEIRSDNTVLIRTGKCDFGQSSIYTAYRQIVAEELGIAVDKIGTVVTGDTDTTPDGGGTFGLLRGAQNLRKVAAYRREALCELAARQFGVPRESLSVNDGVVSGGNRSTTYGQLVAGGDFLLAIPVQGDLTSFFGLQVTGNPPLKPTSAYSIVGAPVKNPSLRSIGKMKRLLI
jgi:CO/xanthine dehydrogenase Mo-binding subunit